MYASNNEKNLMSAMQNDLDCLHIWLNQNRLVLNATKTKIMLFANKNFSNNFHVNYDSHTLESVNVFNYLGLVIDRRLNWYDHVDSIKRKIIPYIFILKRLREYFNKHCLRTVYFAHIHSQIVYLNPVWSGTAAWKLDELNIVHKRAIKVLRNVPLRYPTLKLYSLDYPSFLCVCKVELMVFIYKVLNNLLKNTFNFTCVSEIHTYPTRATANSCFYIETFKTINARNNSLHRGLKEYNLLPGELKRINKLNEFKYAIKEYFINKE